MKDFYKKAARIAATDYFFWAVVVFFIFNALWIAFSGRYPLPFDEGVHLGTIQVYSHHILPFFSHQDPGTYGLGEVTRDPSYLYSYLVSFPYRWFSHFVTNQSAQIVFIRVFGVAFMAAALIVFRRALAYTKSPKAVINLSLLFFVLTPIVPFTAAQVNYDSLFVLMTGAALLFVLKFADELNTAKRINLYALSWAITFCFLASLTKYAFLPIFMAAFVYLAYKVYKFAGRSKQSFGQILSQSYGRLTTASKVIAILTVVATAGLFIERVGVNAIRYHTPSPECDQVLSVEACKQYAPWYRNYQLSDTHRNPTAANVQSINPVVRIFRFPVFLGNWTYNMDYTLFYAISPGGTAVASPLPLIWLISYVAIFAGAIAIIRYYDKLKATVKFTPFLLAMSLVYAGILCLLTFKDYNHFGILVEAQGRYLLPILPIAYLLFAESISIGLNQFKKAHIYKTAAAAVVIVCMLEGGGAVPFVIKSDPTWYWQNTTVVKVNRKSQAILKHIVID